MIPQISLGPDGSGAGLDPDSATIRIRILNQQMPGYGSGFSKMHGSGSGFGKMPGSGSETLEERDIKNAKNNNCRGFIFSIQISFYDLGFKLKSIKIYTRHSQISISVENSPSIFNERIFIFNPRPNELPISDNVPTKSFRNGIEPGATG
jgi:hypothetical protein